MKIVLTTAASETVMLEVPTKVLPSAFAPCLTMDTSAILLPEPAKSSMSEAAKTSGCLCAKGREKENLCYHILDRHSAP